MLSSLLEESVLIREGSLSRANAHLIKRIQAGVLKLGTGKETESDQYSVGDRRRQVKDEPLSGTEVVVV